MSYNTTYLLSLDGLVGEIADVLDNFIFDVVVPHLHTESHFWLPSDVVNDWSVKVALQAFKQRYVVVGVLVDVDTVSLVRH